MGFNAQLGIKAIDHVSGISGVIVSLCQHLGGLSQAAIQGPVDKDGKVPEP
jgi:hypothetical protein